MPPQVIRRNSASGVAPYTIEVGKAADFVLLDRAQHSAGRDLLECVELGDLPGISMVVIDGLPRIGRSRNTPPADKVAEVVGA